jgi:hypothetical protein
VDSSTSSIAPSWTSNGVAPATPEEIKVASYLIVSAAFDDFVPEVDPMVPRKLNYLIGEVNDGTVSDASLKLAKDWLDTTGKCAHYINPVHAVLVSKYNLFLNMSETYTWRTNVIEHLSIISEFYTPPLRFEICIFTYMLVQISRQNSGLFYIMQGGIRPTPSVLTWGKIAPSKEKVRK